MTDNRRDASDEEIASQAEILRLDTGNPYASPLAEDDAVRPEGLLAQGETVTIAYESTAEDLIAAGVFECEKLKGAFLRRFQVVLFAMVVVLVVLCLFPWNTFLVFYLSGCVLFPLALLAIPFYLLFGMAHVRRRKIRDSVLQVCQRATTLLGPVRVSFGPQGMAILEGAVRTRLPWRLIDRVLVNRTRGTATHAFAIRRTWILCRIPRRVFASDADFQKFVDRMQRYIEAAKDKDGEES